MSKLLLPGALGFNQFKLYKASVTLKDGDIHTITVTLDEAYKNARAKAERKLKNAARKKKSAPKTKKSKNKGK